VTDSEITLQVLREIRDSIRTLDSNLSSRIDTTNTRIDATNARLDTTNARLDTLTERVGVVEGTLQEVAAQLLLMGRYLKNRTEVELQELKARVTTLETKVG